MLKHRVALIFTLIIGICTFGFVSANSSNDLPLLGKIIYLDPGHGGY